MVWMLCCIFSGGLYFRTVFLSRMNNCSPHSQVRISGPRIALICCFELWLLAPGAFSSAADGSLAPFVPLCARPRAVTVTSAGSPPRMGERGGGDRHSTDSSLSQSGAQAQGRFWSPPVTAAPAAPAGDGSPGRAVEWGPRWRPPCTWAPQGSRAAVEGSPPQTGHLRDVSHGLGHLSDLVSDLGTPEGPHPVRWKMRIWGLGI